MAKIGSNNLSKAFIGSQEVKKVYHGTEVVYTASGPEPEPSGDLIFWFTTPEFPSIDCSIEVIGEVGDTISVYYDEAFVPTEQTIVNDSAKTYQSTKVTMGAGFIPRKCRITTTGTYFRINANKASYESNTYNGIEIKEITSWGSKITEYPYNCLGGSYTNLSIGKPDKSDGILNLYEIFSGYDYSTATGIQYISDLTNNTGTLNVNYDTIIGNSFRTKLVFSNVELRSNQYIANNNVFLGFAYDYNSANLYIDPNVEKLSIGNGTYYCQTLNLSYATKITEIPDCFWASPSDALRYHLHPLGLKEITKTSANVSSPHLTGLPPNVKRIGDYAFVGYSSTVTGSVITIPNGCEYIGAYGLSVANAGFNVPASVKTIKNNAFTDNASAARTFNFHFYHTDADEIEFVNEPSSLTPTVIQKGTSKITLTYNVYTDNTYIKNQFSSYADSYTIVNLCHLDGTSWE